MPTRRLRLAQMPSRIPASDETCLSDAGSSTRNRPSRRGSVAKPRSSEHRNRILKIVAACLAAVLVACAAVAAFWAWDTWLRFDDSADIQGEWLTANGTALVVIDAEEIHMPDSVDFKYTLDTNNKTISYTFVDLTGGGSYEFSRDRATLTITESDGSQTVFQKYSDSTDGEPRVLSADEAAALMNAGQSQERPLLKVLAIQAKPRVKYRPKLPVKQLVIRPRKPKRPARRHLLRLRPPR